MSIKKYSVVISAFFLFSIFSYSKIVYSLAEEWVYGGITIHDDYYNMNAKLQSYYEYQSASNLLWKIGYAQVRDTLNWDVVMTQLHEFNQTPFKAGLVEGAWGSDMIKGYYIGPGVSYTVNRNWSVLGYSGLYIVTTPFGTSKGKVNINPRQGEATLNKISYNIMPSVGIDVRFLFTGLGI